MDVKVNGVAIELCAHGTPMDPVLECAPCDTAQDVPHRAEPVTALTRAGNKTKRCRHCRATPGNRVHDPAALRADGTPRVKRPRARNTARQGAAFERSVIKMLETTFRYDCIRSAASLGAVDVVAVPAVPLRPLVPETARRPLLFVQCKRTDPNITPAERNALTDLARRANARPAVAYGTGTPGGIGFRLLTGTGPRDWFDWSPAQPIIDTDQLTQQ